MGGLGWIPDVQDARDFVAGGAPFTTAGADLRPDIVELPQQGATNSCVLNALALALAIRDQRRGRPWRFVSRLYGYYYARRLLGPAGLDSDGQMRDGGCRPRDAIKSLLRLGCPDESLWRFDSEHINMRPPHMIRRYAVDLAFSYRRCLSVAGVRAELAAGRAVVAGFSVGEEFMAPDGPTVVRSLGAVRTGGHMMTIVADSPTDGLLWIANSWGPGWRQRGYCAITYDLAAREMGDAWSVS